MSDYAERFGGVGRLYGADGLERLRGAHVAVVGIGGVGSWVAEALARSGIGMLTLVDLDEVCVTNINRQVHAVDGAVGKSKVDAMAERIRAIHPGCDVLPRQCFFSADNADALLGAGFNCVADAIDAFSPKSLLLALCKQRGIPVVTVGGAGGRRDPSRFSLADLSRSKGDPLLSKVRSTLRREYGFPRQSRWKFRIPCVFSDEPVVFPWSDGTVCKTREEGSELALDCESGYGTASFVTGAAGMMMAACIAGDIAAGTKPDKPWGWLGPQ